MSLTWGFFALAVKSISKLRMRSVFAIPMLFPLFEYARAYIFGLLWAGEPSIAGAHWTLGNISYLASPIDAVRIISPFTGIYGMTAAIMAVNILVLIAYEKLKHKPALAAFAILPIIFIISLIPISGDAAGQKARVTLVQTDNKSTGDPLDHLTLSISLLKESADEKPDLVILPEGSNLFTNLPLLFNASQIKSFFSKTFSRPALIIDNSRTIKEDGALVSRSWTLDSKEGIVGWFDKTLLTPMGEYVSYSAAAIMNYVSPTAYSQFAQSRQFSRGPGLFLPIEAGVLKIAVFLCSEVFSPSFSNQAGAGGSNIFAVQTAVSFAHGNRLLQRQLLSASRLRAAENRKTLILASNSGISYIISPYGEVQRKTEKQGYQILTDDVVLMSDRTWYNKVGDMPYLLAFFAVSGLLVLFRTREKII